MVRLAEDHWPTAEWSYYFVADDTLAEDPPLWSSSRSRRAFPPSMKSQHLLIRYIFC